MAHKSVTQTSSKAMRKIPNTIIRKGIYYFNFRPPSDIEAANLSKELKSRGSLRTSDPQIAKKRLSDAHSLFLDQVETLRGDLKIPDDTAKKPKRTIFGISKQHQRHVIERRYQELERDQQVFRQKFADNQDEFERQHLLELSIDNLSINASEMNFNEWRCQTAALFNSAGFQCEPEDFDDDIVLLHQYAEVEIHSRTYHELRGKPFTPKTNEFSKLSVFQYQNPLDQSKTIRELTDEFLTVKGGKVASKTNDAHAQAVKILHDFLGADLPIDFLKGPEGFERGRSLTQFLAKIPLNATQKYPNLSVVDASEREARRGVPECLNANTQHNLFLYLKAIFKLAVTRHWLDVNPLDGMQELLPSKEKRPIIPPSGDDLTRMLSSESFLQQKNRVKKTDKSGRYWTVLLCLFHGFRINEVASLQKTDIKIENNIHYIDLSEYDDDGNRIKSLKTFSSQRRVPLHRRMEAFGFLDYCKQVSDERLFPDLQPDKHQNYGASVSKWFSRLRTSTIGERRKRVKTIHSVRHLVASKIRELTPSEELLWAIGGWSCNGQANASRVYGKQSLSQMKKVIDQIEFEGFDPSFLNEKI